MKIPFSILSICIGICFIIATATFCFYQITLAPAKNVLQDVKGIFKNVLQITTPEITTRGGSTVLEKSAIAELAVASRKTQAIVKYQNTWFNSTKTIIVKGDFVIKAGYNLDSFFRLEIKEDKKEVLVQLPSPKILSIALENYELFYAEDGFINKIQPEDQADVTQRLLAQAREDAARSDIFEEAENQLRTRIHDLLKETGYTIIFVEPKPIPSIKAAQ